jgi:hypothetical protein
VTAQLKPLFSRALEDQIYTNSKRKAEIQKQLKTLKPPSQQHPLCTKLIITTPARSVVDLTIHNTPLPLYS